MKAAANPALLTDLYELTMAASYFHHKMFKPATFSLFIRGYPPHRGYFVNAGLEDVLSLLESFHLEQEDLEYLKNTGLFQDDFLHFLASLRFTGDVHAMPEGRDPKAFPVRLGPGLEQLQRKIVQRTREEELGES